MCSFCKVLVVWGLGFGGVLFWVRLEVFLYFCCRVVGGFDILIVMENVESDFKIDRFKVCVSEE